MTETEILDFIYQTFQLALRLALPLLLISMVVGVVIAIFQAATQINEQTMTFVPKFLAIIAVLGFLGSSMLKLADADPVFNDCDAHERHASLKPGFWGQQYTRAGQGRHCDGLFGYALYLVRRRAVA